MNFGRSMEQAVSIGKYSRSCSSYSSSSIWQIYWASFAADRLLMVPSLGSDLSNHSPGWSNLWPPTDLLDHKPGPRQKLLAHLDTAQGFTQLKLRRRVYVSGATKITLPVQHFYLWPGLYGCRTTNRSKRQTQMDAQTSRSRNALGK